MNRITVLVASLLFTLLVFVPSLVLAECSEVHGEAYINEFNTKSGYVEVYFKPEAPKENYKVEVCNEDGCVEQIFPFDGSSLWIYDELSNIDNNDNFDITLYDSNDDVVDYINVHISQGKGQKADARSFFNTDYDECDSISNSISDDTNSPHLIERDDSGQKQFYRFPDGGGEWIETKHNKNETYGETNSGSQTQIHHFRIDHPSTALTCRSAVITVRACLNAECSELYANDIQINLSPEGWLGGAVQPLGGASVGTYRLRHTEATSVNIGVISQDVLTQNGTLCYSDGSLSECSIEFLDSGFVVTVDNGNSCTDLSGTIQAVQKDDETNLCIGDDSFADTTRDVGFWFNYADPSSGTINPFLDETELNQTETATTTDLSFNDKALAEFSLSYADAGSLNLFARFEGKSSNNEEDLIMTGSTTETFVVVPHHFEVSSPLNNSSSGGTTTGIAAEPFGATITAVCENGDPTPNFAAQTTLSAETPSDPNNNLGTLSNGGLSTEDFNNGEASPIDLSYDEVGNFTLEAESRDYLGSGMDINGNTVVGRFIPHYFELSQGDLTNRVENSCAPASGFTYLGENLEFNYTLTAKNFVGDTTENYIDPFHKFSGDDGETTFSGEVYTIGAINDPNNIAASLSDRVSIEDLERNSGWESGTAAFTVRLNVAREGTPDGPFDDVRFGIYVKDGDGVEITAPGLDIDGNSVAESTQAASATQLRYGRISLENAHGSELLALNMPFFAEYFDGNAFTTNGLDSCTTFALADFKFTDDTGGNGEPGMSQQITSGEGLLSWDSPPHSPGSMDIELDLSTTGSDTPYLQFDWNGDGTYDENPTARATFGIFKGNEHIIYLRETTWR